MIEALFYAFPYVEKLFSLGSDAMHVRIQIVLGLKEISISLFGEILKYSILK